MPKCKKCKIEFPNREVVDGKLRNLSKRKYCLSCSPFGTKKFVGCKGTERVERLCKWCGKIIKNKNAKRCCSQKCDVEYKWDKKKKKIEAEGKIEVGKSNNPNVAKKYLYEVRGHECSICHQTEWMGVPMPLILDHINGNPLDWRLGNLRFVCGNCNMLLPTFAGRNVGKGGGRPYRNKRYHKGKSF